MHKCQVKFKKLNPNLLVELNILINLSSLLRYLMMQLKLISHKTNSVSLYYKIKN
jgi:hypothetical protein